MANPWDDAYGQYGNALRSGDISKEKIQELYGGLSPEFTDSILNIKNQIDQQKKSGTANYWGAGNLASPDAAAWDAAFRLAEKGVGSLYDLKQQDGQTINSKTGKPLEGFGNAYNHDLDFHISYNNEGLPILTASNQASEWVDKYRTPVTMAALLAAGIYGPELLAGAAGAGTGAGTGALVSAGEAAAVGSTVGTGAAASSSLATQLGTSLGFSGSTATAVGNSIIQGGISEATGGDFVKGALGSYVGGQFAGNLANTLGATGANIAGRVAGAAVTGGDPVQALISGGIGAAVPLITAQVPGFDAFGPATQKAINNTVASAIASGGDVSPDMLVRAGLTAAKDYVATAGPNSKDFEQDSFKYNQIFDPKTAGMVDLSEEPVDPDYKFTTDFSVGADYSLAPKEDGLGFKVTAPPEVFNPDGSVNYDLFDYATLSKLGMDMPKSPNIDEMGGGQGLRLPVDGGYITEQGFIPEGYTPNLGDPESFINKPAPGGDVSIQGALDAGAKATLADLNKTKPGTAAKKPSTPGAGLDVNALLSLLGGSQQGAPTVVSSGQDNSADIELMEQIFGTTLSAPPAGDTATQTRELARLLRS